jgi:integrase
MVIGSVLLCLKGGDCTSNQSGQANPVQASELRIHTPAEARPNISSRAFRYAALGGTHTHSAADQTSVTIWLRDGQYVARGRFNGSQFGQQLGRTEEEANQNLRTLLYELDNGIFIPPSQKQNQTIRRRNPNLSPDLRELINQFLTHVAKAKGESTKKTYLDRLRPVLDFEDLAVNRRRWPKAANINNDFVSELQNWLRVTPFQDKKGQDRFRKEKTVRNILETLRTSLNWAKRPENRLLPGIFIMPVTQEILGKEAPKDPFRPSPLSEEDKIKIVGAATDCELLVIGLFILLADRADELAGLCIEDVDQSRRHLLFGINNSDVNFTKGHTAFRIPYPQALEGLIGRLIAGRCQGPLIRQVSCQNQGEDQSVDLEAGWNAEAAKTPSRVQTKNDKKSLFREVMRKNGGASADYIGKLFAKVAKKAGLRGIQPGFCRDSATHLMERSGMSHLSLRYLTSHSTSDILNTYTGMDIDAEMGKYYAMVPTLVQTIAARFPALPVEPVGGEEIL